MTWFFLSRGALRGLWLKRDCRPKVLGPCKVSHLFMFKIQMHKQLKFLKFQCVLFFFLLFRLFLKCFIHKPGGIKCGWLEIQLSVWITLYSPIYCILSEDFSMLFLFLEENTFLTRLKVSNELCKESSQSPRERINLQHQNTIHL